MKFMPHIRGALTKITQTMMPTFPGKDAKWTDKINASHLPQCLMRPNRENSSILGAFT